MGATTHPVADGCVDKAQCGGCFGGVGNDFATMLAARTFQPVHAHPLLWHTTHTVDAQLIAAVSNHNQMQVVWRLWSEQYKMLFVPQSVHRRACILRRSWEVVTVEAALLLAVMLVQVRPILLFKVEPPAIGQ